MIPAEGHGSRSQAEAGSTRRRAALAEIFGPYHLRLGRRAWHVLPYFNG
jgi:hypothetical protein